MGMMNDKIAAAVKRVAAASVDLDRHVGAVREARRMLGERDHARQEASLVLLAAQEELTEAIREASGLKPLPKLCDDGSPCEE